MNPFSPIGITEEQIRFIDLFLIWCALAPAPEMSSDELECAKLNWNRVIMEGRKPGQTIGLGCDDYREPLAKVGHDLFKDLLRVADVLDHLDNSQPYRQVCERLNVMFDQPELTLSAKTLDAISHSGIEKFGFTLAEQYKQELLAKPLALLTEQDFVQQRNLSLAKQQQREANDTLSFDEYLKQRNAI